VHHVGNFCDEMPAAALRVVGGADEGTHHEPPSRQFAEQRRRTYHRWFMNRESFGA
jgi:hypothetical protein